MLQTKSDLAGAPDDISLYATEGYWRERSTGVRRYTLRQDGFVSAWASSQGGSLLTKPLIFEGARLELNFATSAVGSIRVEIQDEEGKPMDGFAAADCPEIFGDTISRPLAGKTTRICQRLSGKPVRLRFASKTQTFIAFSLWIAPQNPGKPSPLADQGCAAGACRLSRAARCTTHFFWDPCELVSQVNEILNIDRGPHQCPHFSTCWPPQVASG
ncbi:MAG: hypothetical protein R3C56_13160 [Pirellulaceae bacterium]